MKITYSWIKEFVDVKISPEKLADKLTMAGLSVASLEEVPGDWVYDIEVTSNRPDWLSVRGIVREVAAITGAKFKSSQASSPKSKVKAKKDLERKTGNSRQLSISIDDKDGCSLYYGNVITGVKVGPSPDWLKKRLEALGIRSVNNVVDITNYCLLEYGQPLHAFDFDKIKGSAIIVRRAKEGEQIVLIDGAEKKLTKDILVIADSAHPMAIAGIMGGRDTEVSSKTINIVLESACFNPVVVRRGSRAIGVATDSSYRFERGVDIPTVKVGLECATRMICELCSGTLAASKQSGTTKALDNRRVTFSIASVQDVLSISIKPQEAKNILEKLGFRVKRKSQDIFEVLVPSYRRDVKISEDITEEIARTYGYDKIPLTAPAIKPFSFDLELTRILEPKIKRLLVAMGLKEVITYGLSGEEDYKKSFMTIPGNAMHLENPLSNDFHILRTTLVPSLLGCASFNANHNHKDFEIFEVARIFSDAREQLSLGIVLSGSRRSSWEKESVPYSLFDLKGILETLFDELQVKDYEWQQPKEPCGFAELKASCQVVVNGKVIASLGKVGQEVKRAWSIKAKEDIFVAEVSIEELASLAHLKRVFEPVSSMPSIFRDLSVVAGPGASYAKIKELIERKTKGYLKRISLMDCYQGKEIPQGSLGFTISLEYASCDKTLTDAQIQPVHEGMLDALKSDLSLALR